jgi:hypothetical protein
MRVLAVLVLLLGACSALDDFSVFKLDGGMNVDGGGDASAPMAPFGAACEANGCMQYNATKAVMCEMMVNTGGGGGAVTFAGGMCTRPCTLGVVGACNEFGVGVADCTQINNVSFCLPHCNDTLGQSCRTGYNCCSNNNRTTGPGSCVPDTVCK